MNLFMSFSFCLCWWLSGLSFEDVFDEFECGEDEWGDRCHVVLPWLMLSVFLAEEVDEFCRCGDE